MPPVVAVSHQAEHHEPAREADRRQQQYRIALHCCRRQEGAHWDGAVRSTKPERESHCRAWKQESPARLGRQLRRGTPQPGQWDGHRRPSLSNQQCMCVKLGAVGALSRAPSALRRVPPESAPVKVGRDAMRKQSAVSTPTKGKPSCGCSHYSEPQPEPGGEPPCRRFDAP